MLKLKNATRKPTPKQFERDIASAYRTLGYTVIRADAGNYLPDYLVFNKDKIFFVEVKRYCSCRNLDQVFNKIRFHQSRQTETIRALSFVIPVEYHIMLKDLGVSCVKFRNGRVVECRGPHSISPETKITARKVRKSNGKRVRPSPSRRLRPSMR